MSHSIQKTLSPEEQELERKRAELDALQGELAQRELELATLVASLGQFEQRYLRIVGVKLAKLDELEARIAETLLLLTPRDSTAADKASYARAQADQSAQACGQYADNIELEPEPFRPDESLKSLYRALAKAVHPDLATNPQDQIRRTAFMAEVNAAYQASDAARLKELWERWQHSPDSVSGDGIGANLIRLIRQIAQLRTRTAAIDKELEQLQAGELYRLWRKAEAAAADGFDLLRAMAADIDSQIEQKRIQLNALLDEFVQRKRAL